MLWGCRAIEPIRWVGFVVGAMIVLGTILSVINTVIVPRLVSSRITHLSWVTLRVLFRISLLQKHSYEQRDRRLAKLGPMTLLVVLIVWVVFFILGYGLMMWPLVRGDIWDALRLSGASFFTLGDTSTSRGGVNILEFIAACSGMITIALQIGYLPTIYSSYNRRETLVTALGIRTGTPIWGPEIIAKHEEEGARQTLPTLFSAWETWSADIAESHASYPFLLAFRSPDVDHSWIVCLLAMLDAAGLFMSLSPTLAPPEARQCIRAGIWALQSLTRVTGPTEREAPLVLSSSLSSLLTYQEFMAGFERIRETGFPIEQTAEEAYCDFTRRRARYERAAYALAEFLVIAPTPWCSIDSSTHGDMNSSVGFHPAGN